MNKGFALGVFGLALMLGGPVAGAAEKVAKKEPIEISADSALEWRRDDKQYVARGAAVARQGDSEIHADELVADYREAEGDRPAIYRLTARGHVKIISSGPSTVTGDLAIYDVDQKTALVTGRDLVMTGPDQTVTARDHFEYAADEGRIRAVGAAQVVRGTDKINADSITAFLASDTDGQRRMVRAQAEGNVVITTLKETATGTRALYERASETATLEGPVTITRDQNVLQGARAVVNLKTSLSTLYGDEKKGGRVKGVFYTSGGEARK